MSMYIWILRSNCKHRNRNVDTIPQFGLFSLTEPWNDLEINLFLFLPTSGNGTVIIGTYTVETGLNQCSLQESKSKTVCYLSTWAKTVNHKHNFSQAAHNIL